MCRKFGTEHPLRDAVFLTPFGPECQVASAPALLFFFSSFLFLCAKRTAAGVRPAGGAPRPQCVLQTGKSKKREKRKEGRRQAARIPTSGGPSFRLRSQWSYSEVRICSRTSETRHFPSRSRSGLLNNAGKATRWAVSVVTCARMIPCIARGRWCPNSHAAVSLVCGNRCPDRFWRSKKSF